MSLRIGDVVPDFSAVTTHGPIRFHEWLEDSWALLFSHHKDFTPICTTELGYLAQRQSEFENRGVKLIGLSIDEIDDHFRWLADISELTGTSVAYPIIADENGAIAGLYDMLPAHIGLGGLSPVQHTVRSIFLIAPDKKLVAQLVYPLGTGRNFDEVLRLIDSVQLTAELPVVTPANWDPGEDVIIAPQLTDELARLQFPEGWRAVKPYIRVIPQPPTAKAKAKKKLEPTDL